MVKSQEVENMTDDLDVEAMLEAPYRKGDEVSKVKENGERESRSSKKSKRRSRSKSRSRSRDREKERDRRRRSRSRSVKRERERERERDRDRDRERERERERRRSRSRSRDRHEREREYRRMRERERERERRIRSRSRSPRRERIERRRRSPSPPGRQHLQIIRPPEQDLTPEERDQRTVFCMQLSARIRARDLEEFFSSVGRVKDVRIITDNKTRRSKGIAYVEFYNVDAVPLALGLAGQKLLGVPIIVQPTQAEKNRAAASSSNLQKGSSGPMRLYVGSLHFNITEDMLRGIFEPFGKIDHIQLIMDPETGRSKGYGFITFHDSEDAKKALEQLNGFELAGRPMKVGHVTERSDTTQGPSFLDSDELDRTGIDLGATGRLQLMAKLAEGLLQTPSGTGFELPSAAANALTVNPLGGLSAPQTTAPPIATQCFMLSNMFDPTVETNPNWDIEIRDDVIEECNKHGGVLHIFVDKASPQGNVYVKCSSVSAAVASVTALHGRWFAGKIITAAYVPLLNYHSLFPDAMTASIFLLPSTQRVS